MQQHHHTITALQLRLGRTGLGWGVRDLGRRTGISPATITRIEKGNAANQATLRTLADELSAAGVTFLEDDGDGPGIRVKSAGVTSGREDDG